MLQNAQRPIAAKPLAPIGADKKMNSLKTKITFTLLATLVFAFLDCKRQKIEKHHTEFNGSWVHWLNNGDYRSIKIDNTGTATVKKIYNDGNREEHSKQCYIKDNWLLLGIVSRKKSNSEFSFKIDMYPSVSTSSFVSDYDTINIGNTYMMLNGSYYKKE